MKTKIILMSLFLFSILFSSCHKDEMSNAVINEPIKHIHAYDYGNLETYREFYDQICFIIETMAEDSEMMALSCLLSEEWIDDELYEDENYNEYNEHADFYGNLASSIFQTNTYQAINESIYQLTGRTLENLEQGEYGHLSYMYEQIQTMGYVRDSILYDLLNNIEVNTMEIVVLYVVCAINNDIMEKDEKRYLTLDDGTHKYLYAFLNHNYPSYHTPFTIWNVPVQNINPWLDHLDSIPHFARQLQFVDSMCFSDYSYLREYLWSETATGVLFVTAMECQETWVNERKIARQTYEKELDQIIRSNFDPATKQALVIAATDKLHRKQQIADDNYSLCLMSATN